MTREQLRVSALIILGVAVFQLAATVLLEIWPPSTGLDKSVQIIQGYAAGFLLMAGGLFAAVRFELFRNFIPHVTLTQTLSHRAISDSYVHLLLTVTLHNSSKVKIDFRECYFRLQLLAPASDEEVESLYAEVFLSEAPDSPSDFQWPTLERKFRPWRRNELLVEPGETLQETCEFIVRAGVRSVLAYTYFRNPRQPSIPEGWGVTTVYDIIAPPNEKEL